MNQFGRPMCVRCWCCDQKMKCDRDAADLVAAAFCIGSDEAYAWRAAGTIFFFFFFFSDKRSGSVAKWTVIHCFPLDWPPTLFVCLPFLAEPRGILFSRFIYRRRNHGRVSTPRRPQIKEFQEKCYTALQFEVRCEQSSATWQANGWTSLNTRASYDEDKKAE